MRSKEEKITILVVDDLLENLKILTQLLVKQGYDVHSVETGQDAIDYASVHLPDLILLDIVLPDIDGFEVCQVLKKNPITSGIPVIFISALTKTEDILHGFSVGGIDYITKPFISEEVYARVRTHLEMSKMRSRLESQTIELEQRNKEVLLLGEEKIQEKVADLKLISNTSFDLLKLDTKESIYSYIKDYVYPISGADYMMVSGYNEKEKMVSSKLLVGLQPFLENITKAIGADISQIKVPLYDVTDQWDLSLRRNIFQIKGGLYELTVQKVPKAICFVIEKILGIDKMFSIGFIWNEKYYGAVTFAFKKGSQFKKMELVQSIIQQISLALNRKHAEELLKASEEKYRSIFENTGNATMIVDEKTKILLANEEFIKVSGYPFEQLFGSSWIKYVAPESIETLINFSTRHKNNSLSGPARIESVLVNSNGEERKVLCNIGKIPYSKNSVVSILDITDLKNAEKKIVNSEKKYRDIFESIQDVYYETDLKGLILEMSPSVGSFSRGQYKREDLIGKSIYDYYLEDGTKEKLVREIKNQKRVIDYDITLKNKDGSLVYSSISAEIKLNSNGKPEKVVGTFRDITDRKRVEELVRSSEEKFNKAFDMAPIAMTIQDANGVFLEANKAYVELTGYSMEETIGHSGEKMQLWADENERRRAVDYFQKYHYFNSYEFRFRKKTGELGVGIISSELITLEGKSVELTIVLDITNRKLAEEKIREKDMQFRKLSANVSDLIFQFTRRPDGTYCVPIASEGIKNIFGCSPEDVLDDFSPISRVIYPEDMTRVLSDIEYSAEHLTLFTCEFRVQIPGKSIQWMYSKSTPEKLADDSITWYGFISDITERKRLEDTQAILVNISNAVISTDNLEAFSRHIFDELGKVIVTRNFYIALYHEQTQTISVPFISDQKDSDITEFQAEKTLTGYVIKNKKSCLITEAFFANLVAKGEAELVGPPSEVWIGVPLFSKEKVIGAIVVQNYPGEETLGEEDLRLLEYVAPQISLALQRKKDEEAIRYSEQQFQTVARISPVGIFRTDGSGSTIYVNPTWCKISGLSFEKSLGDGWLEAVHPEDREKLAEKWKKDSEEETSSFSEYRFIHPDGSIAMVIGQAVPEKNNEGKIIGYVGTITNITERNKLEKTKDILVNISNAVLATDSFESFSRFIFNELRTIINTNNFFIALMNVQTQMISTPFIVDVLDENLIEFPAKKTLTGYVINTKKSLLIDQQALNELIKKGDVELVGPLFEIWIGVPLFSKENVIGAIVIQNYKGEKKLSAKDLKIMEYVAPQISLAIERKKALEDLKAALEKAQESDRLKSAFLANMSHEIRTPMNGILGFTELLKEPKLTGEEQQKFISVIERSGARMLNIIKDLMDISVIEAGQITLSLTETDMKDQINHIYIFFKPEVEKKGMKLVSIMPSSLKQEVILTDREKVAAILINLVKNAIKYSNVGTIEFGYSVKEDHLEFFVRDEGIGIAKEKQEAIFNRFVQADNSLSSKYEGAGLGLAITKAYVELLGGKIWVESTVGVGSVFYFTIPYILKAKQKPVVKENSAMLLEKNILNTIKILIVEDDKMSELLLEKLLTPIAKDVIKAKNGIEAVEACRANPDLDLILMDIKMLEMDGYDATLQIREFNKEVTIIAQTAYALTGDREKALAAGCNDFITKPINRNSLLKMIGKHLG